MDSDILSLNCWVYLDEVERVFPVEISCTKTVGALKKAIRDERFPIRHDRDASEIMLYTINIPSNEGIEAYLRDWTPVGKTWLNGRTQLSTLFPIDDHRGWTIIVNAPTFAEAADMSVVGMTLNCWVRGDRANTAFSVDISSTDTVSNLKAVIKRVNCTEYRDVDARSLALYKVSIPYNNDVEDSLKRLVLNDAAPLDPLVALSNIFLEAPPKNHVHIIIEAPLSPRLRTYTSSSFPSLQLHSVEAQRALFLQNNPKMAPSSGGTLMAFASRQQNKNQVFFCGRPHTACATIPATLRHTVFGQFVDDCKVHDMTPDDFSFAEELRIAMSDFYSKEAGSATAIRKIFGSRFLPLTITLTGDRYSTDGDMSENGHRYVITEFKNEVGSTSADPYSQACLYYLEATREYAKLRWYSPLPCMIILSFGPYLSFAGATWDTHPVIQPFSTLQMHYHPTDTDTQVTVARHLGAFKKAVIKLVEYYRSTEFTGVAPSACRSLFPHRITFTSLHNNTKHTIKYESQPFQDKLFFHGMVDDQRKICIKFVRRYSKAAHQRCASLGHAPMLLGFEEVPGGWFMVVMDRLMEEEWECPAFASSSCTALTASLVDTIRNVLRQLHQASFVHGDVRDANIMVSRSHKARFMLVDFDWAGEIGEVRYPMNVNKGPELWRPDGVVSGAPILSDHDMDMLDHIQKQYCAHYVDTVTDQ